MLSCLLKYGYTFYKKKMHKITPHCALQQFPSVIISMNYNELTMLSFSRPTLSMSILQQFHTPFYRHPLA